MLQKAVLTKAYGRPSFTSKRLLEMIVWQSEGARFIK